MTKNKKVFTLYRACASTSSCSAIRFLERPADLAGVGVGEESKMSLKWKYLVALFVHHSARSPRRGGGRDETILQKEICLKILECHRGNKFFVSFGLCFFLFWCVCLVHVKFSSFHVRIRCRWR